MSEATTTLDVQGMSCGGCTAAVRTIAVRLDGVTEAEVALDPGTATVTYDPAKVTPEAVAEHLSKGGFAAAVRPDA